MQSCYDNTLLATEQRRCRYCRGCEYFDIIGHYGCCNYYLQTGNRRPCRFCLKDCSVRVFRKGFVPSDKHLAFCRKVDAEEQAEQARQAKRKDLSAKEPAPPILTEKELAAYDITEQDRKQGRPLSWDAKYGFLLYQQGFYLYEIAEVFDIRIDRVEYAAKAHGWFANRPVGVQRKRHDIEQAKREYQEYRARQNGQKEGKQ